MGDRTLTDEQWLVLDLLMRAREKGVHRLNRRELLTSGGLPQVARMRLAWAALTVPEEFVVWPTQHDFEITEAGIAVYAMRFGRKPSKAADSVICLPGPEHYRN